MIAFWVTVFFPLLAALGFAGAFTIFSGYHRGDRARAGRAMGRYQLLLYALFVTVPCGLVLARGAAGDTMVRLGLAWPRVGSLGPGSATALAFAAGAVIGVLLFVNEVVVATLLHARLAAKPRAAAALEGRSASFARALPSFGRYLPMAAYVSFAEELVWRGGLITTFTDKYQLGAAGAVAAAAALFGVNHAYHGARNIALKAVDGLVWGGLFVATGSLVSPVTAHLVFQISAWLRVRRSAARRSAATAGIEPCVRE